MKCCLGSGYSMSSPPTVPDGGGVYVNVLHYVRVSKVRVILVTRHRMAMMITMMMMNERDVRQCVRVNKVS